MGGNWKFTIRREKEQLSAQHTTTHGQSSVGVSIAQNSNWQMVSCNTFKSTHSHLLIWFTINTFSLNFSPQITNVAQQGEIERVKDVLLQVASTFFFNLRNNPTTFFSVKRHPRVIWERTNQQERQLLQIWQIHGHQLWLQRSVKKVHPVIVELVLLRWPDWRPHK